ncbi:MAG: hypothetical protein AAF587_18820 [Bacteroidota bacterium]
MKSIIFSFVALSVLLTLTSMIPHSESSVVNLSGDWTVVGGQLNFDIRLVEDGYDLEWYSVSRTLYGEREVRVTDFDHSGSSVYIQLKEDLGMGLTTYTYKLTIQNSSLMTGTADSYTKGWNGLPPLTYHNRVTISRR